VALTPSEFASEVRRVLRETRAGIVAYREGSLGMDDEAVVRGFDRLLEPLNNVDGWVGLAVSVHPDPELREVCEGLEREIADLRTEVSLDRGIYDRLVQTDPQRLSDPLARRLLAHALRDYRRSGVDRDEAGRAEVRQLQEEYVKVAQEFDRNIRDGGRSYVVANGAAGLEGLPEDYIAAHPPREDGAIVLSTDPHDRLAVLSWAEDPELLRAYFLAATNRAMPENLAVLPRLLATRHALARTLGYDHWADYVTEDKMTRSAATARAFLEDLVARVAERAVNERAECLEAKRTREPDATEVHEWERRYWVERIRRERFAFDSREVREYFPYERVKAGVLATAARLFGLEFRRDEERELWHPDVECWELWVTDEGAEPELRGRFYLDMYPREGKYRHAAMFPIVDGVRRSAATGGRTLPEACLVCNFPRPGEGQGAAGAALLLHDQVTTFFHEFGHLLHHLLAGNGEWLSFAGIATERDFVEVPSQLFEQWAWDPEVLASFAHHFEDGRPIPAELVQRMRAAEDHGKGLLLQQQLFYSLLSIEYYDRDPSGLDVTERMIAVKERTTCLPHQDGNHFHAAFGHLNGYSAIYYTYLWSQVIAKDFWSQFQEQPMCAVKAQAYRRAVLEPGGSRDAVDLVRAFLGRDYTTEAFERWLAE
jgi:thimet oligopeptidase